METKDNTRITAAEIKFVRITEKYISITKK
jgi:hypothetical protein